MLAMALFVGRCPGGSKCLTFEERGLLRRSGLGTDAKFPANCSERLGPSATRLLRCSVPRRQQTMPAVRRPSGQKLTTAAAAAIYGFQVTESGLQAAPRTRSAPARRGTAGQTG